MFDSDHETTCSMSLDRFVAHLGIDGVFVLRRMAADIGNVAAG